MAAQFAAKQSRVHRINEQRMRWFSFEIGRGEGQVRYDKGQAFAAQLSVKPRARLMQAVGNNADGDGCADRGPESTGCDETDLLAAFRIFE